VRVLSCFSGIGGLDLGLERAGMTVVAQSEVDAYASRVLAKHWPDVPNLGDITKITEADLERLGPIDLVCGGFPCTDLSVAGKRAGMERGTRSGLFWEMARIVRMVRPKIWVMENVPALLDRSEWMGTLLAEVYASGVFRFVEWDCVPAAAVGAPHRRDRVFIVAHSEGGDGGQQESQRLSSRWATKEPRKRHRRGGSFSHRWKGEPDVGRVAHGVPARVDRLRGLGNAVVPQVAEHVGRIIMDLAEESRPEQRQTKAQPEAEATLDARR